MLTGRNLRPKDTSLLYGKTSDPYLVVKQGSRILARTATQRRTLNPKWNSISVNVRRLQRVEIQCWDYDVLTADDLIGTVTVSAEVFLTPGTKLALVGDDGLDVGLITVNSVVVERQEARRCSIVNMLQERIFVQEGVQGKSQGNRHMAEFHVFRVHNLQTRLCVGWETRY